MNQLVNVAKLTKNDVILVIIVIIIGISIIFPLYSRASKERRRQEMEKDKMIIDVIKENTRVNAGLAQMIETNNVNCVQCKRDQSDKMDQVLERIDLHNDRIVGLTAVLEKRSDE